MEKSLEKLVENLEKLTKNASININDVINKIKTNLNFCENELQKMKNKKKININNQTIEKYLNSVQYYKTQSDPYFHELFTSTELILKKIKQNISQSRGNLDPTLVYNDFNHELNKNYNKNNSEQMMVDLQKDKVIQAQELKLLNDNQGRALSALECYANRCSKDNKTYYFDYYNMNNFGYTKDPSQLRGQCIVQTQLFRMTYMDYIKKYGDYKVNNMDTDKLLGILKNWMDKVNTNDKILYKEMIDIISSSKHSNLSSNSFNYYSKSCQNATMDPRDIACMAPGIYNYNHQRTKEAKKNFIETRKMDSKLIIGQSYKSDQNAELLMEQVKNNQQFYEEQKEIEKTGFS